MGTQSWGYTILGVFLSITATLCSSMANIYIKVTAEKNRQAEKKRPPCCQIGWYIVILLYVGNGLLDFSAFAFAAMSVLAPVSSVTIGINAILAHVILKEVLSRRDMIGTGFLFLGAALAVFAVPRESDDAVTMSDINFKFERPLFVYFSVVKVVIMIMCGIVVHKLNWLSPHHKTPAIQKGSNSGTSINDTGATNPEGSTPIPTESQIIPINEAPHDGKVQNTSQTGALADPLLLPETPTETRQGYPPLTTQEALWLRIRGVCFSMICAGIGAWTNQLAKAGVQLIDTSVHGDNQLMYWQAWAIIISVVPCAALQLYAMSAMMDSFEAVLIIPIYQCVFIFNLILQGAFYFEELSGLTEENLAWFVASLMFILVGIGYLSRSHPR